MKQPAGSGSKRKGKSIQADQQTGSESQKQGTGESTEAKQHGRAARAGRQRSFGQSQQKTEQNEMGPERNWTEARVSTRSVQPAARPTCRPGGRG